MKIKQKDLVIFGSIWALIFAFVGLSTLKTGGEIREWSILISVVFLFATIFKPVVLTSLYRGWVRFGEFTGGIFSKIILSILFYMIFTPIAIFIKLIGVDLLDKKINKKSQTYWIDREDQPQSMKNQF